VLLDDDDEMGDCPVSDDRQEGLERVFEEGGSTAAYRNGSDEAEVHESDAWNAHGLGPEVLTVHCERVVFRALFWNCQRMTQ
jgi:hypothetical protein